jgi:hypothetical protein
MQCLVSAAEAKLWARSRPVGLYLDPMAPLSEATKTHFDHERPDGVNVYRAAADKEWRFGKCVST